MSPALAFILIPFAAAAQALPLSNYANGFDLEGSLIPAAEILRGGVPRDGIPALSDPKFVPAGDARLADDDPVLGVAFGGVAKAYPIRILDWHEIVNDEVGGRRIAITYCPLCGTGMVFDSKVRGIRRRFGVSGLLYNSDVLLYDRETESLWSQIKRRAVAGPSKGLSLKQLPARHTTWADWRREHPASLAMSFETGLDRPYHLPAYRDYRARPDTMFPVSPADSRRGAKDWVLGLIIDERAKAYPIAQCPKREFSDKLGGETVTIRCDRKSDTAYAVDSRGRTIPGTMAYWFAWSAFHPSTEIYRIPGSGRPAGKESSP